MAGWPGRCEHGGGAVLRGSGCLLGTAIIIAAVPVPHTAEPVPVSYAGDLGRLAQLRQLAASLRPVRA